MIPWISGYRRWKPCQGFTLHWYGKSPETPGRKLGHVTLLLEGETVAKRRDEAESALAAIRRIWPLASESQD